MSKRTSRGDDRRELFKTLKAGKLEPVYFVHGPDAFMLDTAVDAIIQAAAPDGLNEFNHDKFRGKDALGDRVRAAAEQLPFMVKRRIVILRNAEEMASKEFDVLGEYFDNPSPSTILIVHTMTTNKALDGRSSAVKKLKKVAVEYEFKAFYEDELDDFIARHAQQRKLRLTREATAHLVEAIGTELFLIVDALERVDLYLGDSSTLRNVEEDTIRHVVAHTRVHSVFALTEALGSRHLERALQVFGTMIESGEPPIRVAAMVSRHFRVLMRLKDPTLRNGDRNDVARAVGVAPFFLKDYQKDAERFSRDELFRLHTLMLETDLALKSSRVSDRILMEALLYNICVRAAA